ncbi:MAG TPA: sigma-70 family RNA polymerase sigma factor [Ktedonobacterales bacterium]
MGDVRQQPEPSFPDRYTTYAERVGMTWPPAAPFEQVLIRAKGRDQPAIGMLYHRFQSAVFRYILSRVADVPSAEDITSETFVAMIRGIASTRATDELGFAAWLLGIARNQVLVHFRRTKTHPQVELKKKHNDEAQSVAEEGDPLLVLMARESWTETMNALNQLPPDQRLVILYRCVLGYPLDEVASFMSKKPGTISALQFRAHLSLARRLDAGARAYAQEPQRSYGYGG